MEKAIAVREVTKLTMIPTWSIRWIFISYILTAPPHHGKPRAV